MHSSQVCEGAGPVESKCSVEGNCKSRPKNEKGRLYTWGSLNQNQASPGDKAERYRSMTLIRTTPSKVRAPALPVTWTGTFSPTGNIPIAALTKKGVKSRPDPLDRRESCLKS